MLNISAVQNKPFQNFFFCNDAFNFDVAKTDLDHYNFSKIRHGKYASYYGEDPGDCGGCYGYDPGPDPDPEPDPGGGEEPNPYPGPEPVQYPDPTPGASGPSPDDDVCEADSNGDGNYQDPCG